MKRSTIQYDLKRGRPLPDRPPPPGGLPAHPLRRRMILVVAAAVGGALAYFTLLLLTPSFGRVVGYANAQPALELDRPAHPSPDHELQHIREQTMLQFQKIGGAADYYWPAPGRITERADCWLVEFTSKIPVYRFLGFEHAYPPAETALYMSVTKADLRLRYGRWCD